MPNLTLTFDNKDTALSVRAFDIREALSSLFEVRVEARSDDADVDFEAMVGLPASFAIESGLAFAGADGTRSYSGVVASVTQTQAETSGLSSYSVVIVPQLWLMTQRRDNRLFQHRRVPDIIGTLLSTWNIEYDAQWDLASYPKLELRTQYNESDFDFFSRLLEEAGISYSFEHQDQRGSVLVLRDRPEGVAAREAGPLPFVDSPNQAAEQEFVTKVGLTQEVRPGMVLLRDFEFRKEMSYVLLGTAEAARGLDAPLQHYRYAPGGFLKELEKGGAILETGVPALPLHGVWGTFTNVAAQQLLNDLPMSGMAKMAATAVLTGNMPGEVGEVIKGGVKGQVLKHGQPLVNKMLTQKLAGKAGAVTNVAADLAGSAVAGLAGRLIDKLFGDDHGTSRHDQEFGTRRAAIDLESLRSGRRRLLFETNAYDVAPGGVIQVTGHPRSDITADHRFLVLATSFSGTHDGPWTLGGEAVFADVPFRPAQRTKKPTILGVQSAVVVGPAGEEIYTDETGRVRVQFHWDREGSFDDHSSCWLRVSQGWAGTHYGMLAVPRVGNEVLVAYLDGDPDQPVVVGRLYNGPAHPPFDLPLHKTQTGIRTLSSPGGAGYNELMFEDAMGQELIRIRAERDLEEVVQRDETLSVGHDMMVNVTNDRKTTIGAVNEATIGVEHRVTMRQLQKGPGPTELKMIDRRIELTTGEASIVLEGPNITIQAKGVITMLSTDNDVVIQGGPWVKINCGATEGEESDTYTSHHITGIVKDQDEKPAVGLTVSVKASDGAIQQVQTDSTGRYFALVPPGKCLVSLTGNAPFGDKDVNLDHMAQDPIEMDDDGPAV